MSVSFVDADLLVDCLATIRGQDSNRNQCFTLLCVQRKRALLWFFRVFPWHATERGSVILVAVQIEPSCSS